VDGGNDQIARTIAWVEEVGRPMRQEVEGLKRAIWWAAGSAMGAGLILGLFAPTILKKLGFG
jgi:hypothetical protein